MDLTIRFINEPGIVAQLLTWAQDSLFCHTEGLGRDGKSWVGAHSGTGVQSRAHDWCKPTFERRYAIPVNTVQYESAMRFMDSKIGCPYNYQDIVGLALHNRIGFSNHEVICSAFMLLWLQAAGIAPLNVLESFAYLVTPETLHLSPIFIGRGIAIDFP